MAGVGEEALPELVNSKEALELREGVAREVGLKRRTRVIVGISDAAAHSLGLGALAPSTVAVNLGTSGAVRACTSTPILDKEGMGLFCYISGYGTWLVGDAINNAMVAVNWLIGEFLKGYKRSPKERALTPVSTFPVLTAEAAKSPLESLDEEVRNVRPMPGGLIFLPFLTGERFPIRDHYVRGALYGLSLSTKPVEVVRALLEGVAFSLRWILDVMIRCGVRAKEARVSGGGASLRSWREILADVLGLRVAYPGTIGASLVGTAIFAKLALGRYSNVQEAVESELRGVEFEVVAPELRRREVYEKGYELFKELYEAIRPYARRHHEMLGS